MGVYIKGMEMPKGCAFCRIRKRNGKKMVCQLCDEEWDIHDPMSADHRLDNCPLRPVPPHGRLIDADAFIKRISELVRKADTDGFDLGAAWYTAFIRHIELAPTIIPAEEGE